MVTMMMVVGSGVLRRSVLKIIMPPRSRDLVVLIVAPPSSHKKGKFPPAPEGMTSPQKRQAEVLNNMTVEIQRSINSSFRGLKCSWSLLDSNALKFR